MFWKKKKENDKYTYEIEAKYIGTTMKLNKGIFFINCEYIDGDKKYNFISEKIKSDPQEYIKDNLVESFKIKIMEKDGLPIYSKYKIVIDDILNWIDTQNKE